MSGADPVTVQSAAAGARLRLRVKPGGRADQLLGSFNKALKLQVRAAPERGRANDAVVRLLARELGLSRSDIEIVAGAGSQDKVVAIRGASADEVARRLEAAGIPAETSDFN